MDIFIERFEGNYALCRLDDKNKNLIKLPLRELPEGVKELSVVTMKSNGSMFINSYAKELRMEKIAKSLKCKKYKFTFY
ncbi:MAG: DUF3006 domain-containing protein [Ruminococcaceae bacterium]|jgi:hypothetical protein|nr:DUF3006 domain-containing protein [Oscillospiraceae bacterium]